MGWAARANKTVEKRKKYAESHTAPDPILTPRKATVTPLGATLAAGLLATMATGAVPMPKPPRPPFRPPRRKR